MARNKLYEEATEVTAKDGEVILDGPDDVDVKITPEAAEETLWWKEPSWLVVSAVCEIYPTSRTDWDRSHCSGGGGSTLLRALDAHKT